MQSQVQEYIANNELAKAAELCLSVNDSEPQLWVFNSIAKVAVEYRNQHNQDAALTHLEKAVQKWQGIPKPVFFLMELGHARRTLLQFESAASAYAQVIEITPGHFWANLFYATSLLKLGLADKAHDVFKRFDSQFVTPEESTPEWLTLRIEIAIARDESQSLQSYYQLCAYRIHHFKLYQRHRLIRLLYKLQDTSLVVKCIQSLVFWLSDDASCTYLFARLFYDIDRLNSCIRTLLSLRSIANEPAYYMDLLITSVCETAEVNRDNTWEQATSFLDKQYADGNKAGYYWQLWQDYFEPQTAEYPFIANKNYNVGTERTLQQFTLLYATQPRLPIAQPEQASPFSGSVISCSFGSVASKNPTLLKTGSQSVEVKRFSIGNAIEFINTHYPKRFYSAWRLTRSQADKEELFKLCYLAKNGGVFVPDNIQGNPGKLTLLTNYPESLLLVKGYMGINTRIVVSKPNHPLLKAILEQIVQNLTNRSRLPGFYTTGALCWAKVYCQYVEEVERRGVNANVRIISAHTAFI